MRASGARSSRFRDNSYLQPAVFAVRWLVPRDAGAFPNLVTRASLRSQFQFDFRGPWSP